MGCYQINLDTLPSIAIVIPARLNSERLPSKALLNFNNLPMIEHVRRRGLLNSYNVPVYVTSGDSQILETTSSFGGLISQSELEHLNGTSRVHEFAQTTPFTHFLILQGDEILVLPDQLDSIIASILEHPEVDFWNMVTPLKDQAELSNPSVVKCLVKQNAEILTIFRKSPLVAEIDSQMNLILKICGLFAVSRNALSLMSNLQATPLETSESIEQLKYLEFGYNIRAILTEISYPSINLPEDVATVSKILLTDDWQNDVLKKIL